MIQQLFSFTGFRHIVHQCMVVDCVLQQYSAAVLFLLVPGGSGLVVHNAQTYGMAVVIHTVVNAVNRSAEQEGMLFAFIVFNRPRCLAEVLFCVQDPPAAVFSAQCLVKPVKILDSIRQQFFRLLFDQAIGVCRRCDHVDFLLFLEEFLQKRFVRKTAVFAA